MLSEEVRVCVFVMLAMIVVNVGDVIGTCVRCEENASLKSCFSWNPDSFCVLGIVRFSVIDGYILL